VIPIEEISIGKRLLAWYSAVRRGLPQGPGLPGLVVVFGHGRTCVVLNEIEKLRELFYIGDW
jgi:hypothetical protein